MAHYSKALCVGEHFAPVTEKASRGDFKLQFSAAAVVRAHIYKFGFSAAEFVHNRAHVIVRHFYHQIFDRFVALAVYLFKNNLGARNLKFVTLAAHIFYKNGKVQLSPAENLKGIRAVGFLNAHGNVCFYFLEKARP